MPLDMFTGRQLQELPSLIFSASTNTTNITVSASMDFPHVTKVTRNYPPIHHKYLLYT